MSTLGSKEIRPVHCNGIPCTHHCANEQCTWFICGGCRKTIVMKTEEEQ